MLMMNKGDEEDDYGLDAGDVNKDADAHDDDVVVVNEDADAYDDDDCLGVGLLISPHSSQLKNLVFAADHCIVIEVKADMYSQAFSVGTEHLNTIYVHSLGHGVDEANVRLSMYYKTNLPKARIQSGIVLNEAILARDIAKALQVQSSFCPGMWL